MAMTPAERLAALQAIRAGIDAEIAKAKADTLAVSNAAKVRSFDTPLGQVNITRSEPSIVVSDRGAFIKDVMTKNPEEVVVEPSVRATHEKYLREKRWVRVGKEVVDNETGEVVPYLVVTEPGDPVVQWPSSKSQRDAKAAAAAWAESRVNELTGAFLALTDGGGA